MPTATAKSRKKVIAKSADAGDVHVGQTLYDGLGDPAVVQAIDGDNVTMKMPSGNTLVVSLQVIRTGEKAGFIGTTNPGVSDALSGLDDAENDEDN